MQINWRQPIVMLIALVSDPPLDGAAKLVEAAGKGNLAFASFLVLVVAAIAWKFFGKDAQWVRIGAFLVIIASIVFVVFLLALPLPNKEVAKADAATVPLAVSTPQDTKPTAIAKQCTGEKDIIFTPQMPGVMQTTPDGRRVDLGDGGGGTRLEKWAYSWRAPATVTSVTCTVQRNEHVLAQNRDGSKAECEGSINGGNDAMTMHVTWEGPCDQQ
jgi:hypothetical protein